MTAVALVGLAISIVALVINLVVHVRYKRRGW